jgi:hypothetical protein
MKLGRLVEPSAIKRLGPQRKSRLVAAILDFNMVAISDSFSLFRYLRYYSSFKEPQTKSLVTLGKSLYFDCLDL